MSDILANRVAMIKEMNRVSYLQPDEQGSFVRKLEEEGTLANYPRVEIEEWLRVNCDSPFDETLLKARQLGKARYFESNPMSENDKQLMINFLLTIKNSNKADGFGQNQCYFNAQMTLLQAYPLLQSDKWLSKLKYCEGYVCIPNSLYPFAHAWCMFDNYLIDPTLLHPDRETGVRREDLQDRIYGDIPKGWKYFGVKFDAASVYRMVKRNNCWYAPFMDHSRSNFKLLETLNKMQNN